MLGNTRALIPAHYLTAAVRSRLVNHLLTPADCAEARYLLLELGIDIQPPPAEAAMPDILKAQLSLLAASEEDAHQQRLARLCEGLVQFYLLAHPQDEEGEIARLNVALAPYQMRFSEQDGRLENLSSPLADPAPQTDISFTPDAELPPFQGIRQRRLQFLHSQGAPP
ncbi:MAG: hypothetical protein ACO1RX_03985 [Candidatus Sericytochromatia bacterium]